MTILLYFGMYIDSCYLMYVRGSVVVFINFIGNDFQLLAHI